MLTRICILILAGFLVGRPGVSAASEIPLLPDAKIVIDGYADEPAWSKVEAIDLGFEVSPSVGPQTAWKTKYKVFHDSRSLYVFVSAADDHPEEINAVSSKQDALRTSDDHVAIYVDPQGTGRRALVFVVNARSAIADYVTSAVGETSPNWNGAWRVRAIVTSAGYQAEFEIPFSTLGIDDLAPETLVGLNVTRQVGRGRFPRLSSSLVDPAKTCPECQYQRFHVKGDVARTSAYRVQPYVLQAVESGQGKETSSSADMGVDLLWQSSNGRKAVVTLNPDFSQVEIDQIQFSINKKFALSFPERRPFFTEEAGAFRTLLPLLYTRNIVDPSVGAQYISRQNGSTTALLFADDSVTSYVQPGLESSFRKTLEGQSYNFVGRYLSAPSQDHSWGVSLTARSGAGGYSNEVAAVDGMYASGSSRLRGQVAVSSATTDNSDARNAGGAFELEHTLDLRPYRSYTTVEYVSSGFRSDLGLFNQVDVATINHRSSLEFYAKDKTVEIQQAAVDLSIYDQRAGSGQDLYFSTGLSGYVLLKSNFSVIGSLAFADETYQGRSFKTAGYNLSVSDTFKDKYTVALQYDGGDAVDYSVPSMGTSNSYAASFNYAGGDHLTLNASGVYSTFDSPLGTSFTTKSLNSGATFDFNKNNHVTGILSFGALAAEESASFPAFNSTLLDYQVVYRLDFGAFRYLIAGVSGELSSDEKGIRSLQRDRTFSFLKLVYGFGTAR